jgi:hypothetical protein
MTNSYLLILFILFVFSLLFIGYRADRKFRAIKANKYIIEDLEKKWLKLVSIKDSFLNPWPFPFAQTFFSPIELRLWVRPSNTCLYKIVIAEDKNWEVRSFWVRLIIYNYMLSDIEWVERK